ncbi:MAG: Hsp20/alpha crystallin family protein [Planctomycetaceae bacterium]
MMTTQLSASRTGLFPWFRRGGLPSTLRDEVQDLFERFWNENGETAGALIPAMDLSETDGSLQARIDLPGLDAKDVNVQVRNNYLVVTGETKEEKEEKGKTYHRIERHSGKISRSILLPCDVNENQIDAKFHSGVLTVTLPKAEQAKSKKVEVKAV